jgi:nitrate/nitrite-specific signal transduction histidine kinase
MSDIAIVHAQERHQVAIHRIHDRNSPVRILSDGLGLGRSQHPLRGSGINAHRPRGRWLTGRLRLRPDTIWRNRRDDDQRQDRYKTSHHDLRF